MYELVFPVISLLSSDLSLQGLLPSSKDEFLTYAVTAGLYFSGLQSCFYAYSILKLGQEMVYGDMQQNPSALLMNSVVGGVDLTSKKFEKAGKRVKACYSSSCWVEGLKEAGVAAVQAIVLDQAIKLVSQAVAEEAPAATGAEQHNAQTAQPNAKDIAMNIGGKAVNAVAYVGIGVAKTALYGTLFVGVGAAMAVGGLAQLAWGLVD